MATTSTAGAALEGTIQGLRFSNPETFWTVANVRTSEGDLTVVGTLPGLAEGMTVRLEGRWDESPRFGKQFRAERFTEIVPATREGLKRYLASGFVDGIGEGFAKRLVDAFGAETIEIILNDPERLKEVPGLGKKRAEALREAFRERRGAQDALVFLLGLGIPRGSAMKILKRYGDDTVASVRKNPYRLAQDVHGIGFMKADQVAAGLSIAADHPERLRAGLVHALREARDEGHVRVRRDLLLARAETLLGIGGPPVESALDLLAGDRRVVIAPSDDPGITTEPSVYLAALFDAEVGLAWHLARLMQAPSTPFPPEAVRAAAQRLGIALAPGQERAVALALEHPVSIVTGGPGTGKTTIIRTLLEASPLAPHKVALAAPTGRAAKRMAEATLRAASTLHRLLEFNPQEGGFNRTEEDPLEAELVIVDEASMVDLPLACSLVRAIANGARLVLVGDKDQLPPVGPGSPLTDLIGSGRIPVARLTDIYRQGKGSAIVEAAHALNHGLPIAATPPGEALRDFYFVTREEPDQIRAMIEQLVCERIPERFGLDPRRDIQVLAPMRAGPIGVELLNERLQLLLNPPPPAPPGEALVLGAASPRAPFRAGDKVMQIRNDYERGVFNGDIGFVRRIDGANLEVVVDDKLVVYDRDSWDDLVLAYAVTVHKSQGSEYPAVVVPVSTHHFKMLRRNLLYTAVTRGKRLVVLVGTEKAMRIAVGNASVEVRDSGLAAAMARALDLGVEGHAPDLAPVLETDA
ncbi:MAG: ATP-dependent RecD-like DNA helicase [Deltaproteobacteria bacterium]|nr:ATP-dependent RecD-like DNA helicase [Deltaproteobacteria bacterium]